MSVHRCPRCSNQWDSDFEDREGLLCGNCAEEAEEEAGEVETQKPLSGPLRTAMEASSVGLRSDLSILHWHSPICKPTPSRSALPAHGGQICVVSGGCKFRWLSTPMPGSFWLRGNQSGLNQGNTLKSALRSGRGMAPVGRTNNPSQ